MQLKEEWADYIHNRLEAARKELRDKEMLLLEEALMIGNHSLAAKAMGISKRTLYYKIKEHGFNNRSFRGQQAEDNNAIRRSVTEQNQQGANSDTKAERRIS